MIVASSLNEDGLERMDNWYLFIALILGNFLLFKLFFLGGGGLFIKRDTSSLGSQQTGCLLRVLNVFI